MKDKYKQASLNGKKTRMHRKVWELANGEIPKGMAVHHINSDKHDNRIENLALVTNAENMRKSDQFGKGYEVIARKLARPYRAKRRIFGKPIHLGMFGTPCGAYLASMMGYITHGL
jgi:hypothetical protein